MVVKALVKDKKTDKTVALDIIHNGKQLTVDIEEVRHKKPQFDNAILSVNGIVRAKSGNLPVRYINDRHNKLVVYHGSPNAVVSPVYGYGEDKHDYGRGFYTTQHKELAKEWAAAQVNRVGYLHKYCIDMTGLKVFDFNKVSELAWLAELMSHRAADKSVRYRRLSVEFINKFKVDITGYDIIHGWRADASYFAIAKRFVRNELDYELIGRLLRLGDLNNQVCIKSKKAFAQITEVGKPEIVGAEYYNKYRARDLKARTMMNNMIESEENTVKHGLEYVISEEFKQ